MLATFSNSNYHESTASGKYYPGDDAKSETENYPDDPLLLTLVGSAALQKPRLLRGRLGGNLYRLFKAGVTREFRDWLQPADYSFTRIFFLTVTRMSQCIIICPSCEREILSDNQVRRTPRGRVICEQCAEDTYLDVPLA